MVADEQAPVRIEGAILKEPAAAPATIGPTAPDGVRLTLTRAAKTTIAAMKSARAAKLETVTLDQLQSVLDADD